MENAVKALYIAAGVLIAVMILSLASVLYASLQGYVEDSNNRIKSNDINSFNTQYLNCINISNGTKEFDITIQDVVTIASSAYESNKEHSYNVNDWEVNENSLYVAVYLKGTRIDQTINEEMAQILQSHKEDTFICSSDDIKISSGSGQVYSINFR